MERLLWKTFPKGEINEKIEYWVDVWDDLITHFTKTHYGLELVNPHLVLIVLIDEIEHNELRNKETRHYLLNAVANFLKHDPVVKTNLQAEFSLILHGFNNQPLFYLLQSVKAALSFFKDGQYFFETYGVFRKMLADPLWQPNDEALIESLANSLIVELLLKGYSLKTIQDIPRSIFCDTSNVGHNFPTDVDWNDFVDLPEEGRKQYELKRADEVKVMHLDKRLSAFTKYFTRKAHDHIFIFEVEGLKGEAEFQIGPVTFYSPKIRSFIKEQADAKTNELLKEFELFRRDKNQYFANAAIQISCIDPDSGKLHAAEVADKALDLLRSRYKPECRLKILKDQYIHLSKAGRLRGHGSSATDSPLLKWHNSFDLKTFSEDKNDVNSLEQTSHYLFSAKEAQSPLEQKVSDGLHWFRKGEEADRLEDRLLHYWIVIEKIFTFPSSSAPLIKGNDKLEPKIYLISELLSASAAFNFIYWIGWTLYNYLNNLACYPLAAFPGHALITLPKELAEKCCLQPNFSGPIHLKQIVANLDELAQALDKSVVKKRVIHANRFYHDGAFAKEEIERIVARTKEDVFLIYRYRNSIVHNAHYDLSLLQPFVEKAADLAQLALNMLIYERSKMASAAVEQIFVSKHVQVQRIVERLDKKLPVDFLGVQTWNVPPPQQTCTT